MRFCLVERTLDFRAVSDRFRLQSSLPLLARAPRLVLQTTSQFFNDASLSLIDSSHDGPHTTAVLCRSVRADCVTATQVSELESGTDKFLTRNARLAERIRNVARNGFRATDVSAAHFRARVEPVRATLRRVVRFLSD
jgi:hypothetical protein